MNLKNPLLRTLVSLASKKPPRSPVSPEKILVVATTALGDTLWATPAIESLRKSFPEAHIAVLTSPIGLQIFANNPWVDAVYLFKRPLHLWKRLWGQFDTVLIFHASQRIVFPFCASLGAIRVVGTEGLNKGLDDLLTHRLNNRHKHEIERRLDLVKAIGGTVHSKTLSFFFKPEEKRKLSGRWIVIHPGAKDGYKLWPVSHFASVGRALKKELGCEILITGTRSEKELMTTLASQIPGAHLANPDMSLREFASLLSSVELLICNDSGPLHLASALETPTIGIYSPTNPALCGPYESTTTIAVAKAPTCTPCLKRACGRPFCLLQIGPEEIIERALNLFFSPDKIKRGCAGENHPCN